MRHTFSKTSVSVPTNGRLRSADEHRSNSPAIKTSIILIFSFNSDAKCLKLNYKMHNVYIYIIFFNVCVCMYKYMSQLIK